MVDTRFHNFSGPQSLGALMRKAGVQDVDAAWNAVQIIGADEPELAIEGEIVLCASKKYLEGLGHTKASAAIVGLGMAGEVPGNVLAIESTFPHAVFASVLEQLYPNATAELLLNTIAGSSEVFAESGVVLGRNVVLGPDVEIGQGTVIGANAVIGKGVTIGRDCVIGSNVTIECAHLGDRVVLHAGVRIGTEGFGWLDHGKSNQKIPQLGRVIIQDGVEIGANSTVDRGALSDTTIGAGTKIDNLVQIGHNCRIGRNCLIAAMSGLSGSTIVGDGVLMGGGVGTSGHLTIGAGSVVHGRAAVTKDWPAGSKLAGAPAQDIKSFWRELAHLRKIGRGDRG